MVLDYECPYCKAEIFGSFGDNVYCKKCNKTFETDNDTNDGDSYYCWLTGTEWDGMVDVDDNYYLNYIHWNPAK